METPAAQPPQDDDGGGSKKAAGKEDPAAPDAATNPDQAEAQDTTATQLPIVVMGQPPVPPADVERAAGRGTAAEGAAAPGDKARPRAVPPSQAMPAMAIGTSDAAEDGEATASATPADGEATTRDNPAGSAEPLPAKLAAALAEGIPSPNQGPNPAPPDASLALLPPAPAAGGPIQGVHGAPTSAEAAPRHVVEGVPVSAVPVEIGLKSLQGINRFDIRLDPEDLGRIDVRLDISDEGRVRAHIIVEQPAALSTLQRESQMLERALEQAGFRTGSDGISLGLRGEGDGRAGQGDARGSQPSGEAPQPEPSVEAPSPPPTWNLRWSRASGIDRRV